MKKAIFPGSFDPITIGHEALIKRSLSFFDAIIIAIGVNTEKKYLFSIEQRKQFIEKTFENEPKISTITYEGLTVDLCKKENAHFILRGLRNTTDFEFEKAIAQTNKQLSGIETFFLMTNPEHTHISSSIVRDLIKNKGDYKKFVPQWVKNNF